MSAQTPLMICDEDPKARAALKAALGAYGPPFADIAVGAPEEAGEAVFHLLPKGEARTGVTGFEKPVRLGLLMDQIRRQLARPQETGPLQIGPYSLDIAAGSLHRETGTPIRLTEKEVHILTLLHAAQGAPVERRALLEKVWDYAEGVETHTLETHIYRLRQKIEEDAAKPQILLTQESAYSLKI